jgi:hypothetical protein
MGKNRRTKNKGNNRPSIKTIMMQNLEFQKQLQVAKAVITKFVLDMDFAAKESTLEDGPASTEERLFPDMQDAWF